MVLSGNEGLSVGDVQNRLILPSGERWRGKKERDKESEGNAYVTREAKLRPFDCFSENCLVKIVTDY